MNTEVIPTQSNGPDVRRYQAVAPAWHTTIILAIFFGFALNAARSGGLTPVGGGHSRIANYVAVIVLEWALVWFIHAGVKRRGFSLRDLIGGDWTRLWFVLRDTAIALGFLIAFAIVVQALGHLLKIAPTSGLRSAIPQTGAEVVVFLFTAFTAACCEELVFRGYLQRQFAAFTQSAAAAIVLQGVSFGLVHGYQGWRYVVVITVFGISFGLLATWRRSLRPGMIAHFVQDGVGGLVARHLLR
ncbi:MAG: CPBP family intramembrane glutamic endopeptidase [Chthoniobacterales bacterium]